MNFLDFYAVVEADRDVLNPISPEKLARVAAYAGLRDGLKVLDIGSGKAAMLRQWARTWAIHGTGVELNPVFVQEARSRAQAEGVAQRLTLHEGRALEFTPAQEGYDVVACLGAPFALGSVRDALRWMCRHVRPGGSVVLGDVYRRAPAPVEAAGEWWAAEPTLAVKSAEFAAVGLDLVGLTVASVDDWDHYSSLMWQAAHRWAALNPEHPDRAQVLACTLESREKYLRWEREHLGWAVWVGRPRPAQEGPRGGVQVPRE